MGPRFCARVMCAALILNFAGETMSHAREILRNSVHMKDAPKWVSGAQIDSSADRIQSFLEWSIRRCEVYWYSDAESFRQAHGQSPTVRAFYRPSDNSIHLGPVVNETNFGQILGHELTHAVIAQKHKDAIPKWFEEGLANYLSKNGAVDYLWLKKQSLPKDVRNLVHPLSGTNEDIRYHYLASQALAEMIASKCDLRNLLRLSVQRKMENYLENICRISDLNASFKTWVESRQSL